MKRFEESLKRNTPYEETVTDYSKVTYNMNGEHVTFVTCKLRNDLLYAGYDELSISMILEAIHHHDGAMHNRIKA